MRCNERLAVPLMPSVHAWELPEKWRKGKPVSRVAAMVFVVVWLLCVTLAIFLALRVF